MRVNEANIFLFIATIIIGILISMNINLKGQSKFLDVEQYQKAYDDRTKIQNEISDLEDQYADMNRKIYKYEKSNKTNNEVIDEISKELSNNKMALGLVPVIGDGIKVTLDDAPEVILGADYNASMLIHDWDLIRVINDMRNAGAEAISVNGYRVVFSSAGLCAGATIDLDGIKIVAPFYVTAIGDKEVMLNFIETQENHIKRLKSRRCYVEMESVYDEKLPAYTGELQSNYLNQK